jgi:hypothetical protein
MFRNTTKSRVNRPAFVFATRCKLAASAPVEQLISRLHLIRQPLYQGDKLSRLAPPSELIERRHPCGISWLAKGRTIGAYFAGTIRVLPFKIILGC